MIEKIAAYTDALNRQDFAAVEKMFAENAQYISPGLPAPMQGRAAMMAAFRAYFAKHADQVTGDEDVRQTGPNVVEGRWWLKSHASRRTGRQRITFNDQGLIEKIEVWDD